MSPGGSSNERVPLWLRMSRFSLTDFKTPLLLRRVHHSLQWRIANPSFNKPTTASGRNVLRAGIGLFPCLRMGSRLKMSGVGSIFGEQALFLTGRSKAKIFRLATSHTFQQTASTDSGRKQGKLGELSVRFAVALSRATLRVDFADSPRGRAGRSILPQFPTASLRRMVGSLLTLMLITGANPTLAEQPVAGGCVGCRAADGSFSPYSCPHRQIDTCPGQEVAAQTSPHRPFPARTAGMWRYTYFYGMNYARPSDFRLLYDYPWYKRGDYLPRGEAQSLLEAQHPEWTPVEAAPEESNPFDAPAGAASFNGSTNTGSARFDPSSQSRSR